jgi:hypothetical protein
MVGRVVDPETRYIYLRNRYYDPNTARFLTTRPRCRHDPVGPFFGFPGVLACHEWP